MSAIRLGRTVPHPWVGVSQLGPPTSKRLCMQVASARSRDEWDWMESLADLGLFFGGLGVFFVGIEALYGVSVWDKK